MLEAEIKLEIVRNLKLFCPEVIVVDRIFSGKIKSVYSSGWIQGAEAGTPDLFAIIRHDGGRVLFIEVKKPGGRQSEEQKIFQNRISDLVNVHYILAFSLMDVIDYVNKKVLDKKNEL